MFVIFFVPKQPNSPFRFLQNDASEIDPNSIPEPQYEEIIEMEQDEPSSDHEQNIVETDTGDNGGTARRMVNLLKLYKLN